MNYRTFLVLELKNLFGGRAAALAFACVALAGAYAVFHGAQLIERQRETIAQLPAMQSANTARLLGYKKGAELGDVAYYLTFKTAHEPSSWAAFSVGQRDVNPYHVKVRLLALEGQLYDSELTNPTNLLFGNFDLSFVIVFLFPLLVIALTHNFLSAEQESGTWNLVRAQPVAPSRILLLRLALRFAVVAGLALALLAAGGLLLGAEPDERFLFAALVALAYLAFWFGAAAFVASFGRSSNFNALTLLGVWIALALLAAALLTNLTAALYPVTESMETIVRQREGYHEKWDRPRGETMAKFFAKYPELAGYAVPEDKFSWGWYYAMQQMGDEEAAEASARFRDKLAARARFAARAADLLPSVAAQLEFNRIARTDLADHLAYLDSVRAYHERLRLTMYPHIFRGDKVEQIDFAALPSHHFSDEDAPAEWPRAALSIAVWAVALFALAWLRLRRL